LVKLLTIALVVTFAGINSAAAFDHVTCKQFTGFDQSQQLLFVRGLLSGMGATVGLLNSSVRAIEKTSTDANTVKGAQMAAAGVAKSLSGDAGSSAENLTSGIRKLCSDPKYADRPAATAAVDLLMGIKE